MAKQMGKSLLVGKYGDRARKAAEVHRNDDVDFGGFVNLPAGIEDGIAQLVECKFDTFKNGDLKGEVYFSAVGIVRSPQTHGGVVTEGLRTRIGPEPICDTPNRQSRPKMEDHLGWVQNELKKLGASPDALDADNLETTAAALAQAQPFFRFRTWKGRPTPQYPDPRTNESWMGACEYVEPESSDMEDHSAPAAPPKAAANGAAKKPGGLKAPPPAPPKKELEEAMGRPNFEEEDLDNDAALAEDNDDDAQQRLTEAALAAGLDEDAVTTAASWADLVEQIRAAREGGGEAEESEQEPAPEPEKGQVFQYRPVDAKTKKQARLAVDVEVVAVDKKSRTVSLKNLTDKKTLYKGVPFDELIESE